MDLFCTCKQTCETLLIKELDLYNFTTQKRTAGVIAHSDNRDTTIPDICFAHTTLIDPLEITADSAAALSGKLADGFLRHAKNNRFEEAWPCLFFTAIPEASLNHRIKAVKDRFNVTLKKAMSRVAKLATDTMACPNKMLSGFFVCFLEHDRCFISYKAIQNGQQRMKYDDQSPSRSFLKIEEAFRIMNTAPTKGSTVVDLGAAPGGWSYAAAKRGARVFAVDNGPLKGGAKNNPLILHAEQDAFALKPERQFNWLLCDMVEDPFRIIDVLHTWLSHGWCHSFIVNFKTGQADPIAVLKRLRQQDRGKIAPLCSMLLVRQLYHDRDEITAMGTILLSQRFVGM